MKTSISKLAAVTLTAAVMAINLSCGDKDKKEEDPTLSIDPSVTGTGIVFSSEGGTTATAGSATVNTTFTVVTNQESWKVEINKTWVHKSESGNTFTLSADKVTSATPPEAATVTVSAGKAQPVTFSVQQLAEGASLAVSPIDKTLVFSADGETLSSAGGDPVSEVFTVTQNVGSWNVAVEPNNSWLKADKDGSNTFILTAERNLSLTAIPSATVTVTAGEATPWVINVTQEVAEPIFEVDPPNRAVAFSADGETATSDGAAFTPTFTVTTNMASWDVNVEDSKTWLKATKGANNTFTLTADDNPDPVERTADVTVTAGTLTPVVISVTQFGGVSSAVMVKKSTGEWIPLEEEATDIYSANVSFAAKSDFVIDIEGTFYGFETYSGNGGVGTVVHQNAALPVRLNGPIYTVKESTGYLVPGAESAVNKLYTDFTEAVTVYVRVDRSVAKPTYYLKLVENDPDLLIEMRFDLMCFGGDWVKPSQGTTIGALTNTPIAATNDGMGPGTGYTSSTNGTDIGAYTPNETHAPIYVKNRGLAGWEYKNIYEFAGYIRLCSTNSTTTQYYSAITTPKLAGISGTANLTVTFDGMCFGTNAVANTKIEIAVKGPGAITSAQVIKDDTGVLITIPVEAGDKLFYLLPTVHNFGYANANPKKWSNFTFTVSGATADTQISWDCETDDTQVSGNYRYMLDNIIVRKN